MPERSGPLSHIRVLDMGRIMAAPWATQILADMGADVIKIEKPGVGDDTRSWGPPFLRDQEGATTRESGYYLSANRGKRSVTIDMSKPEGQDVIRRLAGRSDVVIENFKVGKLAEYGLDAASLRAAKPSLIYCSITGFGQDGPRRDQAAYDFAVQAMGGLMSITGERDGLPGGGPQKVGLPIVDLMTGMYAAVAILSALARRAEAGCGETIDIAMLDVSTAFLANQAMNYLLSEKAPTRRGNQHPNIQPQDVFRCSDGFFVLAVGNDGQFAKLCQALKHPEWSRDDRFATNAARVSVTKDLTELLTGEFLKWKQVDIIAALDAAGVPCAPINDIGKVFEDHQVRHRRILRNLAHPLSGVVPQVVSPIRLSDSPLAYDRAPPLLGQDTDAVLAEIGISVSERRRLSETDVT